MTIPILFETEKMMTCFNCKKDWNAVAACWNEKEINCKEHERKYIYAPCQEDLLERLEKEKNLKHGYCVWDKDKLNGMEIKERELREQYVTGLLDLYSRTARGE